MEYNALLDRITVDSSICHGKPYIRNLRYPVTSILEYLAAGDTVEDILEEFNELEKEDVLACLAFAILAVNAKGSLVIPTAV